MTAARPRPPADQTRPGVPAPSKPTLSPLQLVGSAGAAATSAVVASFFGVAGTVIGAALASVITTVSATLYSVSLRKTNERLRLLTSRVAGNRPAGGAAPRTLVGPPLPAEAGPRRLPPGVDPRRPPARSRRFYVRIAAGTAVVFVAAMVIVTGIELIGQKPVSALVTGSSSTGGTTVGDLTETGSQKAAPTSTPAPSTSTNTAPGSAATSSSASERTATSTASSSTASSTPTSSATSAASGRTSSAPSTSAAQTSSAPTP